MNEHERGRCKESHSRWVDRLTEVQADLSKISHVADAALELAKNDVDGRFTDAVEVLLNDVDLRVDAGYDLLQKMKEEVNEWA